MASPIITDFVDEIIESLDNDYQLARIERFWLGGTAGPSGGQGVRPGGYIGQLIQRMVAYDTTEAATLAGSGSLVDNLNHIRHNILTVSGLASSGVGTFLNLSDTPNSYSGQATKYVRVKTSEDGLEFVTSAPGGSGTSHVHGVTRWSVASGTSSLPLPDYAYQILSLTNNGLTVDPLDYTLVDYINIVLDNSTVSDVIFTAQYITLSD